MVEQGQEIEEQAPMVKCDLPIVIRCASLVARSAKLSDWCLFPSWRVSCDSCFQSYGDCFKSQGICKGMPHCMLIIVYVHGMISLSSVSSVSYWGVCSNSSKATSAHRHKGLSISWHTLSCHRHCLLCCSFPSHFPSSSSPLHLSSLHRKPFCLVSSAYWSYAQTTTLHL